MKKLLVISDSFMPRIDGVAKFLSEVLPSLSEEWSITILAPETKQNYKNTENYHIVRFPTYNFTINDYPIAKLNRSAMLPYIKEADLIFVQDLHILGMLGILAAKKMHKPILMYTHVIEWELVPKSLPLRLPHFIQVFIGWLVKNFVRQFFNQCTTILVPTNDMFYMFEQEHIHPVKTLVPLGINTNRFVPPKNKRDVKIMLGLNPDNIIIGYCGRLAREKSLVTLYDAFQNLYKHNKNITLLIVGKGLEGETAIFKSKENVILAG